MILEKALQRLEWRFTNGTFTPNQKDFDAVNDIITWINNQKSEAINNNHLFAKLYLYELNRLTELHHTTTFDLLPQKELSRLLNTPLELFYEAFYKNFNNQIQQEVFENNGIEIIPKHQKTEVQLNQERVALRNMSKEDVLKIISEAYTYQEVTEILNNMISEALNRFA